MSGGINTYAYVESNPLIFIDPLGLQGVSQGGGPGNNPFQPNRGPSFSPDRPPAAGENGLGVAILGGAISGLGAATGVAGVVTCGALLAAGGIGWFVGSQINDAFGDEIQTGIEFFFPHDPIVGSIDCY